MIEVLRPGPLTTVQDLGRPGMAALGVPVSGAADAAGLTLANRLVGNPEDAAALELTFGGARLRYLGSAPLIEDNTVRSDPTTLLNLEVGYEFTSMLSVALSLLNALDSDDNDISYYYDSQLANEGAPVTDVHLHPVERRTLRLGLRARF